MRFAYFCYRGWAFSLLDKMLAQVSETSSEIALVAVVAYEGEKIDFSKYPNVVVFDPKDKAKTIELIREYNIDVALFYGWSWMVPDELTKTMDCLCLHPSLLPKYRGGTPFQHQILANEQSGGITIFRMNDVLDGGDILAQNEFPLTGTLQDILNRVIDSGAEATLEIIKNYEAGTIVYQPQQNLDQFPVYKRRRPEESILPFEKIKDMYANDLYNLVRALDNPFPNCRIVLSDGNYLLLQEVEVLDTAPENSVFVNDKIPHKHDVWYLQARDKALKIVRYNIISYGQ